MQCNVNRLGQAAVSAVPSQPMSKDGYLPLDREIQDWLEGVIAMITGMPPERIPGRDAWLPWWKDFYNRIAQRVANCDRRNMEAHCMPLITKQEWDELWAVFAPYQRKVRPTRSTAAPMLGEDNRWYAPDGLGGTLVWDGSYWCRA